MSKEELAEKIFPDIQTNYKNHDWLSERAILAAKNKDVDELNNIIQSNIQSETVTYKSVETVVEADEAAKFKRLRFPIRLAFASTINKAQGQFSELCGLDLETNCFSHGQLYGACSRVGKPYNLYYLYRNKQKYCTPISIVKLNILDVIENQKMSNNAMTIIVNKNTKDQVARHSFKETANMFTTKTLQFTDKRQKSTQQQQ
ncbi:unnamed protein product, partial [Onchocerca ochengi]